MISPIPALIHWVDAEFSSQRAILFPPTSSGFHTMLVVAVREVKQAERRDKEDRWTERERI